MAAQLTSRENRKRKALLLLPLVVVPLLTLAFWSLGGGKPESDERIEKAGLNLKLPDAQLKDERGKTKLSFYEAGEQQPSPWEDDAFRDTAFRQSNSGLPASPTQNNTHSPDLYNPAPPPGSASYSAPGEEMILQKIAVLNRQISDPYQSAKKEQSGTTKRDQHIAANDIDRLEGLMQTLEHKGSQNPELEQLNGLMDKILAIQHPEKVRQEDKKEGAAGSEPLHQVSATPGGATIVCLTEALGSEDAGRSFFNIEQDMNAAKENVVRAVIHRSGVLEDGSVVSLRLIEDIYISGNLVPAGRIIYGEGHIRGERMEVVIQSINNRGMLLPVKMEVVDMDGLPGIYVPHSMGRDVGKTAMDNASQTLNLATLDPSLKAQLASAGVGAVKSLISKKAKRVRVHVKEGYQVLLRNLK